MPCSSCLLGSFGATFFFDKDVFGMVSTPVRAVMAAADKDAVDIAGGGALKGARLDEDDVEDDVDMLFLVDVFEDDADTGVLSFEVVECDEDEENDDDEVEYDADVGSSSSEYRALFDLTRVRRV